jgi:caffeoyl-CoA O-methyltransferase
MSTEHLILNEALQSYLAPLHSGHGDALLEELRVETQKLCGERAVMQISGPQGTLLSLLIGITQARNAVEVGTFTGYSALCMARALPADGRLLCCDISEEWTAVGRRYWERAGVAHKIDLRIAPAGETLRSLPPGTKFDLAFIDADKPGYDAYYEALLPMMRPNALFVFDNMLYNGKIEDPVDEGALALNALNRKLSADPRVESVLLPFSDGLNFARVR